MSGEKVRRLGKYEVGEQLGEPGGFGTVYKTWDTVLYIHVALKVLDPLLARRDPVFVQNFLNEARTAAGLNHPGIVRIFDVSEDQGTYFIAMQYLPGATLAEIITREAPMRVTRVTELLRPIAAALDYAHGRQPPLIHRDVKPQNIILGEEGQPVLCDFGLVHAAKGTSYSSLSGRTIAGTAQYAAPEQLSTQRINEVGPATDVYALGIVAYEMLTGRVPFDGETAAVIGSQLADPPPPPRTLNPRISEAVERVILSALAKKPAERPQSAGEFVAQLAAAGAEKQPGGGWPAWWPPNVRPVVALGVVTVIFFALALMLVIGKTTGRGALGPWFWTATPTPTAAATATPASTPSVVPTATRPAASTAATAILATPVPPSPTPMPATPTPALPTLTATVPPVPQGTSVPIRTQVSTVAQVPAATPTPAEPAQCQPWYKKPAPGYGILLIENHIGGELSIDHATGGSGHWILAAKTDQEPTRIWLELPAGFHKFTTGTTVPIFSPIVSQGLAIGIQVTVEDQQSYVALVSCTATNHNTPTLGAWNGVCVFPMEVPAKCR